MRVRMEPSSGQFFATDPYVRRFWTAVLGPSAIVELLRLSQAGRREAEVPAPLRLRPLVEVGLVRIASDGLVVRELLPPVPGHLLTRLPPRLRREHALIQTSSPSAECPQQGQGEGDDLPSQKAEADPEANAATADQHRHHPGQEPADPGSG